MIAFQVVLFRQERKGMLEEVSPCLFYIMSQSVSGEAKSRS